MDTSTPLTVPQPDEIRARLAAAVAEARTLRQLLRLSEAAQRAAEARERQAREGVRRAE
jgi:hypothetical protein